MNTHKENKQLLSKRAHPFPQFYYLADDSENTRLNAQQKKNIRFLPVKSARFYNKLNNRKHSEVKNPTLGRVFPAKPVDT